MIFPRIQFYEIDDQPWFPKYLRERIQSCLKLSWTFKVPFLQKASPAQLLVSTLRRVLGDNVYNYTYVDFCSGAGGPTPFIEKEFNKQLGTAASRQNPAAVKFVLTDIHPHIPDWEEAAKRSDNLTYIDEPVDAANAPDSLNRNGTIKIFRLFNLAFHHFDNKLASDILKNTLETADGFGIFELQERTISSMITVASLGLLHAIITPYYFWHVPGHLFFTYVIPILPFVLVFDGYISSLRTRTAGEVKELIKNCGASSEDWEVHSGHEQHTWPIGYMSWIIAVKK